MKKLLYFLIIISTIACEQKKKVDLLVMNAKVYTVDDDFTLTKAFIVNDGKILELGDGEKLLLKYEPETSYNAGGKVIVPGLIDAHAHFYNLGLQLQTVDLTETKSFNEVVQKIVAFQKEKELPFITGRGWDQNDWKIKQFPNKDTLDKLFPDTPVAITRIDGHAILANSKALKMAGITKNTKVEGGEIEIKKGKLTGILIDNPMEMIWNVLPKPSKKQETEGLMEAQKIAFQYGLTTIDDAGLSKASIMLIDSLQKAGDLKMRLYAMVQNKEEDVDYFLNEGILKTERLNVRSVKAYADGALGSHGAALRKPYSDKKKHFGAMLIGREDFKKLALKISNTDFQLNTHAIGDSANHVVLKIYDSILEFEKNKRWRVEHAQVITEEDFKYFKGKSNIIPSVQPTHATSDMYWAEERLGSKRIKNAYAYKKLKQKAGLLALGTDFPVEKVNPFLTFYAAVARKDSNGYPTKGFQKENSLSREEALRGMTIWAAFSNFEEDEKGSIEVGKYADFTVLDRDLMLIPEEDLIKIKAMATFINGEKVFSAEKENNKSEKKEVH